MTLDIEFANAVATFYELVEAEETGEVDVPTLLELDAAWEPVHKDVPASYQPRTLGSSGILSNISGDVSGVIDRLYVDLELVESIQTADRVDVTHEGVTYRWRIENIAAVSMDGDGYCWVELADFGD